MEKQQGKTFFKESLNWSADHLFYIFIIGVIGFLLISHIWGKKDPEALFEATTPYKADSRYFIYLFPDSNSPKNYRLSADILIGEGPDRNDIQVEDIYLEDGRGIYFGCAVQLKTENFCKDQDGKEWMIVLSDWEKAKTIKEIQDSKKEVDDIVNSIMNEIN
ncbi:MAG: hypothetical protein ACSLEX_03505 [Minisyncoccota bacterium]